MRLPSPDRTDGAALLDELVTGAEIGRRLGVSRERVRQWASDARYRFPTALGRIGRAVVWRWSDVAAWARGRDFGGAKAPARINSARRRT